MVATPSLLSEAGEALPTRWVGRFRILTGFGATRVEHGTAVPVDRARVFTSKLNDVMRPAGRVIDVQMRKRFPAATETNDFDVVLAAAIGGTLDDGIEPWDITATGKYTDTLYSHGPAPEGRHSRSSSGRQTSRT